MNAVDMIVNIALLHNGNADAARRLIQHYSEALDHDWNARRDFYDRKVDEAAARMALVDGLRLKALWSEIKAFYDAETDACSAAHEAEIEKLLADPGAWDDPLFEHCDAGLTDEDWLQIDRLIGEEIFGEPAR